MGRGNEINSVSVRVQQLEEQVAGLQKSAREDRSKLQQRAEAAEEKLQGCEGKMTRQEEEYAELQEYISVAEENIGAAKDSADMLKADKVEHELIIQQLEREVAALHENLDAESTNNVALKQELEVAKSRRDVILAELQSLQAQWKHQAPELARVQSESEEALARVQSELEEHLSAREASDMETERLQARHRVSLRSAKASKCIFAWAGVCVRVRSFLHHSNARGTNAS